MATAAPVSKLDSTASFNSFRTSEQKILIALLEQKPLQNNQIARRVGITQEHRCRILKFLTEEGSITSKFHAPRRLSKLSHPGRQTAEHISEAKKIAANIKHSC